VREQAPQGLGREGKTSSAAWKDLSCLLTCRFLLFCTSLLCSLCSCALGKPICSSRTACPLGSMREQSLLGCPFERFCRPVQAWLSVLRRRASATPPFTSPDSEKRAQDTSRSVMSSLAGSGHSPDSDSSLGICSAHALGAEGRVFIQVQRAYMGVTRGPATETRS